ncbi:MAG: ATPase, partial [Archaeoglobaceae archaeon]
LEVPVIVRVRVRRSQHSEAKSVLEEEKDEIEAKEETAVETKEVKENEERKGFLSRIFRSRKP